MSEPMINNILGTQNYFGYLHQYFSFSIVKALHTLHRVQRKLLFNQTKPDERHALGSKSPSDHKEDPS